MRWYRLGALLAGVALFAGGLALGWQGQRAHTTLDHELSVEAEERAGLVVEYFSRARDVTLLTAQNPVFADFYAARGDRLSRIRYDGELMARVNHALTYLQQLYPGRLGEACFIDATGPENARVVNGRPADAGDLSPDESRNPFFGPTFALAVGRVWQARPYVSPDTHEWVLSDSTQVALPGSQRAIIHFELTVEGLRQAIAPEEPDLRLQVLDRGSGQVVVDSQLPQRTGQPLGAPAPPWAAHTAGGSHTARMFESSGRELAYLSLPVAADSEGVNRTAVNANDWVIVASAPAIPATWAGPLAVGPLLLTIGGALLLLLAAAGYWHHQRVLATAAATDHLTGLANRGRFHQRLEALFAAATPAAVLLLDLDRFKIVNDTLGHPAGDALLVAVADRLRQAVGPEYLVARLGGDEFAVLVCGARTRQQLGRLANDVVRAIRQPLPIDGVPVSTSASLGIAMTPEHADTAARMLAYADVAMYRAKRTGGPYHIYDPDRDRHERDRLSLESALHLAIERGDIGLHYQPITEISTGRLIGVEALARWHHEELGSVPPDQFVTLAEQTGLIHPLTLQLLDRALRQCADWSAHGMPLRVSVNLSALNCTDPDLPDQVERLLTRHRVPAELLRLEVTERAAVEPEARCVLARLHRLGVSLALDDFGTGYSSLSYLKTLPMDDIKIDRSFVQALSADPADDVIIRATVLMARALGRTVTAEGVEDTACLRALDRLGVHTAQGYLISPALAPSQLTTWASQRQASPPQSPELSGDAVDSRSSATG